MSSRRLVGRRNQNLLRSIPRPTAFTVNIEDKSEVVAIDTTKHEVVAHWPLAPGEEPSGIAFDAAHHRLFSTCHNKMMTMLDTRKRQSRRHHQPIGTGVDGAAFDDATQLVFASCGEGVTNIVKEETPEKLSGRANFENGTRRANDGARPKNASDIFADRTVSTAAVTISRRVPRATERRAEHIQAARLRSN